MKKSCILLIDSDRNFAFVWQFILKQQGFVAPAALEVREAINVFRTHSPDVILCDYDTHKLCKRYERNLLRRLIDQKKIPVIVMGDLGDRGDKISIHSHVKGYLQKPFSRKQLMNVLVHFELEFAQYKNRNDLN
ncbi:MAG: response regulator [Calditrichaeota bacterium]|nr:response regulator [Calditrichota bacterium]